jgi:GNAT superfamily N-acetyltransferase
MKAPTLTVDTLNPINDLCAAAKVLKAAHEANAKNVAIAHPAPNDISILGGLLSSSAQTAVYVAKVNGEVVGVMELERFLFPWNPSVTCLRNGNFAVLPEYRKTNAADILLLKAREYAREQKMILYTGQMTDEQAETKDRWTRIKGGKYIGGNFVWEPLE